MLPSSQSGVYVCFRCQPQLLRRRAIAAAAFQHARFLSQTNRRPVDQTLYKLADKKYGRKIYPHGKLRGKKGGEVRESSETLPVNALGRPAEIILLRDADLDRSKDEDVQAKDASSKIPVKPRKSSKRDILDSVGQVSVRLDQVSLTKAIEELRDTTLKRQTQKGDHITQEEKDKLMFRLSEGFSATHLNHYARGGKKGKNLLVRTVKQSQHLPYSDWRPGVSPPDKKHLILSGHAGSASISKDKLARIIIERGWQLHTDNIMEIGEIDVYDAQSFLKARDEYGTQILDQIAEQRHVKMEALTENVLRITGDRDAAMEALGDLSQKCLAVSSESIPLIKVKRTFTPGSNSPKFEIMPPSSNPNISGIISLAARNSISNSDLSLLNATTGAMTKPGFIKHPPQVYFVSDASLLEANITQSFLKISAYNADQLNDAQRAIFCMSDLATRSRYSFTANSAQVSTAPGLAPLPSALPHHDRHTEKTVQRMISTVRKQSGTVQKNPIHSEDSSSKIVEGIMADASLAIPILKKSDVWKTASKTDFTTRLGFVYADAWARTEQEGHKLTGLFTPGLLHLTPLLSYLSQIPPTGQARNLISFVFRHDPPHFSSSQNSRSKKPLPKKLAATKMEHYKDPLPEIRFDFELWPDKDGVTIAPTFERARAIMFDSHHCIALPDKAIDFSVTETIAPSVDLKHLGIGGVVDRTFNPIINEMKASIQGKSRIRAPSIIDIPLPKDWIAKNHASQLAQVPEDPLKKTHLKAKYRFVGVEHKQSIPFKWQGNDLSFTTVESGKLGPRYLELSVADSTSVAKSAMVREAKLRAAFAIGFELAELVDRAAKKKLKFTNEKSNKIQAEAEADIAPLEQEQEQEKAVEAVAEEEYAVEEEEHVEELRAAASG